MKFVASFKRSPNGTRIKSDLFLEITARLSNVGTAYQIKNDPTNIFEIPPARTRIPVGQIKGGILRVISLHFLTGFWQKSAKVRKCRKANIVRTAKNRPYTHSCFIYISRAECYAFA